MSTTYEALLGKIRETGQLESVGELLDWDQETYMPPNGLKARADQLSLIAQLIHDRKTSPEVGELLSRLDGRSPDPVQETNVRETRRTYERASKVPTELVGRIARSAVLAKAVWAKARADSAFAPFAPHLQELLELKREVADRIGYPQEPYDALLDEFEPGARASAIADIFSALRRPLTEFVKQLAESKTKPDSSILNRHFPRPAQERFARKLAEAIGFDFQSGRMDVSTHPFCSGTTPHDVRLTTRYSEDFFPSAIFGTLHEAGHGVYEQGLDPKHVFTPMGRAVSLGVHESQSRLWENMVGRSRAFWEHFYPDCRRTFPDSLGDVSLDAFVGAINTVQPSLIRVEADEVTYSLHVILRFETEREMIAGAIAVADIPDAWNSKMQDVLGITPPNDREGCLQDIHWSMGMFGYFPTYALGNLYAAQFHEAAWRAIPDLTDRLSRGDFTTLLDWLRTNIHRHGQRYRAAELAEVVTGRRVSTEPFMTYLHEKFRPIYGLDGE